MKALSFSFLVLLASALPLVAQNAPFPAPPHPSSQRLDALLKGFAERTSSLESFSTKTTCTIVHPLTKQATALVGEAAFLKPNLTRIDLAQQDEVGKQDADELDLVRLYCDGTSIYEFLPKDKLILVHELPKKSLTNCPALWERLTNCLHGMISDRFSLWRGPLSCFRGTTETDLKDRFDITLAKESDWYAYLMITPKTSADKQEFAVAQLTIWLKNPNPQGQKADLTMLPCRLWYKQPNGREVTHTFRDTQPNAVLDKKSFLPPQIEGYKLEKVAPPVAKPEPTVRP